MAKNTLLNTNTENLNDILANSKIYKVLLYQRDYAWDEDNWEDLWNDIVEIYERDQRHYMGAIVIQNVGNKTFHIIDGQQRLVTLSLIVLAVVKNIQGLIDAGIERENNQERIAILMNKYIGSKSVGSLLYSSKLFLNENNDAFYQTYLIQLRQPIAPLRLNKSNQQIGKAFKFYQEKIHDFFQAKDLRNGQTLGNFLDLCVAERLFFILITVDDELNAYTLFETLNARGTDLAPTDLLKNYLFSIAGKVESDLRHIKNQWQNITSLIPFDRFPTFLRHFWNAQNRLVRQDQLFRTIRNSYKEPDQVFHLLDNLESSANLYAALVNPYDEFWGGNRQIGNKIRELKLFGVTQCFPLLLSAYEKFSLNDFEKTLKICIVISFRYNIISEKNPNQMENSYNEVAIRVFNSTISTPEQMFSELKALYVPDEEFKNYFAVKQYNAKRHKTLIRYILISIENQVAGTNHDYETSPTTTEHILPENPGAEWEKLFEPEIQENYIHRIGNYTLLESSKNRDCQNKPYAAKKPIYETSQYRTTNQIHFPDWNPAQLNGRQAALAKIASSIWKIDY